MVLMIQQHLVPVCTCGLVPCMVRYVYVPGTAPAGMIGCMIDVQCIIFCCLVGGWWMADWRVADLRLAWRCYCGY